MKVNIISKKKQELKSKALLYFFCYMPLYLCSVVCPFVMFNYPVHVSDLLFKVTRTAAFNALLTMSIWYLVVALVFFFPHKSNSNRSALQFTLPRSVYIHAIILSTVIGGGISIYYTLFLAPIVVREIFYPLTLLPIVSCLLCLLYLKTCSSQVMKWVVLTIFIINLLVISFLPILQGTSYVVAFGLVALVYGCTLLKTKRRVWVLLTVITLVIVPMEMVGKNLIRQQHISTVTGFGKIQKDVSIFPRLNQGLQSDQKSASSGLLNYYNVRHIFGISSSSKIYYFLSRVINRFDNLNEFAYVKVVTPEKIPYWGGASYKHFLFSFVPRVIWPNKPVDDIGQVYGHRYSFIKPDDKASYWSLPVSAEGYISYGWAGLVLSAIFFGFVTRFIWAYLIGVSPGIGNAVIGAVTVFCLLQGDADTNTTLGLFLHCLVMYFFIFGVVAVLLKKRRSLNSQKVVNFTIHSDKT